MTYTIVPSLLHGHELDSVTITLFTGPFQQAICYRYCKPETLTYTASQRP